MKLGDCLPKSHAGTQGPQILAARTEQRADKPRVSQSVQLL